MLKAASGGTARGVSGATCPPEPNARILEGQPAPHASDTTHLGRDPTPHARIDEWDARSLDSCQVFIEVALRTVYPVPPAGVEGDALVRPGTPEGAEATQAPSGTSREPRNRNPING